MAIGITKEPPYLLTLQLRHGQHFRLSLWTRGKPQSPLLGHLVSFCNDVVLNMTSTTSARCLSSHLVPQADMKKTEGRLTTVIQEQGEIRQALELQASHLDNHCIHDGTTCE